MNLHNVWLVAQKEYWRVVRKPSFWAATLMLPAFIGLVSFISGYSAQQTEKKIQEEVASAKRILIVDIAGVIPYQLIATPYESAESEEDSVRLLQEGEVDGVFVYPADVYTTKQVRVYQSYDGLFTQGKFEPIARLFLEQSIISTIGDPGKISLLNGAVTVSTTSYKGGELVELKLEQFIFPVVAVVLYFLLVFLSNNFLLMSVSEEKENRMIEIMLSIMRSTELIGGKIVGMSSVAFTQLGTLLILGGVVLYFSSTKLPIAIDYSSIEWNWMQLISSLFCMISGFLIMGSIMVGVGAAMPTYKDAQSFSSVFVIAAIFPVYFATLIIAEPNGLIAQITSYFPLTAPLVLLARNALGELSVLEILISSIILVFYVIGGFYLAHKLFELGSLEYNQKVGFGSLFGSMKKRNQD